MTLSTSLLIWLYSVVNGKDLRQPKDLPNGNATRNVRSGNPKGH